MLDNHLENVESVLAPITDGRYCVQWGLLKPLFRSITHGDQAPTRWADLEGPGRRGFIQCIPQLTALQSRTKISGVAARG